MSSSIRRLTREQFADGTTIDGNRLEGALDDVVNRVNAVQIGDLKRRFFQTQYVGGYMPMPERGVGGALTGAPGVQDVFPWLPVYNGRETTTNAAAQDFITPAAGFSNRYRMKGTFNDDIEPERIDVAYVADQFVWSNSFLFFRPVIVIGVSVFVHVDEVEYDNPLVYSSIVGEPPPNKTIGGTLVDMAVELSVDNPVSKEARNLNDIEYHRINFRFDSRRFSNLGGVNGTEPGSHTPTDMSPAHPVNDGEVLTPGGMWLDDQNLNIPIHEGARVRLNMLIPKYTVGATSWPAGWQAGAHPEGDDIYHNQYWRRQSMR